MNNKKKRATRTEDDPDKDKAIVIDRDLKQKEVTLASRDIDLTDPRFKSVYDAIKGLIVGQQLTVQQITIMVPLAMQTLSSITTMNGQQKKVLVIQVFQYLVAEMAFSTPDQKALAQNFIDNGIGTLIDTVYNASQGTYAFAPSDSTNTYSVDQFNVVYNNIKDMVVNKQLDVQTILVLVPTIMIQVGQFANLTGLQRKDMVVQIIQQLMTDYKPSDANAQLILTFVSAQLPYVIDVIYRSAVGSYVYTKIETGWVSCWTCCKKTTVPTTPKGLF